jgi:hypothetical protein
MEGLTSDPVGDSRKRAYVVGHACDETLSVFGAVPFTSLVCLVQTIDRLQFYATC